MMKAVNSLLVIAILLFATVMTWTYFAVHGDSTSTLPQAGIGGGPENTNFTSEFRTLLGEHGNLAVLHLTSLYDGKNTADTSRQLEDNAQSLASVFQQLGTPADKELFLRSFRRHIEEYEIYTKGLKDKKPAAMTTAKENLKMHAMDFGILAHKLMPDISEVHATQLMNDHVNLTLAIIDAHAKNDTVKKLQLIKEANAQAVTFADELGKAADASTKKN